MIDNINKLIEKYSNKNVVFSSCEKKWLLILSINETKIKDIHQYSFNIGNNLYVYDIINKFDLSISKESIDTKFDNNKIKLDKFKYINNYFYFISPHAAYFYDLPDDYSGKYIKWNTEGKKICEGTYINGLKHSEWTYYDDENNVSNMINYVLNRKCNALSYRKDKSKKSQYLYDDKENIISWSEWDVYGNLVIEGKLKDNDYHYIFTKYFDSGKIHTISKYVNKKILRKIIFNENGNVVSNNNYNTPAPYLSNECLSYYAME